MENPDDKAASNPVQWLVEAWTGKLTEAVEAMTGERPQVGWQPGAATAGTPALWWEQPFSLVPSAVVWIGAPEPAWLDLGSRTLRGAGIDSSNPADAKNTYLEMISQALNGLAQVVGARLGRAVSCENGKEIAAPPQELDSFDLDLTLAGTQLPALLFRFGRSLWDVFERGAASAGGTGLAEQPAPVPQPEAPLEKGAHGKTKTLDLLMEVELPVSVSFGRAQLPLKDVLKLTTGSIVELNRAISEPVEVIVNNCVIARGEVVVIDGNYGVRIQEIISRDNRMRTLK